MGSRFKELLPSVIGQLTSNMAASPLAEVVGMLATSGAAAIAPLKLAESASYLALFLGTAFIQDCRARKTSAEQQLQLKHLESAVRRGDRETLAALAAQQEWIRQAIEKGSEAFNAAWRDRTQTLLGTAGSTPKDIAEALDGLTIIEFDTNWRVRAIEQAFVRLPTRDEAALKADLKGLSTSAQMDEALSLLRRLSESRPAGSTTAADASKSALSGGNETLVEAVERIVRDAKAGDAAAAEALGTGDPAKAADYFQERLARFDRARGDLERRVQEEEVSLARQAAEVWYRVGRIGEARSALERILSAFPDDLDAINELGHIARLEGRLGEAARLYERVGNLASDDLGRAVSFSGLGVIERTRGNLDAAEAYHKKALAISEKIGRQKWMANHYGNLGLIEQTRGNLDAAEGYHKKALAINEKVGSQEGMANHYGNLGLIEQTRGNLDAAEAYHKKALTIDEKVGRQEGMGRQCGSLGVVAMMRGNLNAAGAYHRKSLAINEKLGSQEGMAIQYANLGLIERMRGNLDAAEEYHKKALAIAEKLCIQEGMASQYGNLGLIERTRGNLDAAEAYHKKALAIDEKIGRQKGIAFQYGNLGLIERTRGNLELAEVYLKKSLAIDEKIGSQKEMANKYVNLGLIELTRESLDVAEEYCKKSLAIAEKFGSQEEMANGYGSLGLVEGMRGNRDEARRLWMLARDLFRKVGENDRAEQVQTVLDELDEAEGHEGGERAKQ